MIIQGVEVGNIEENLTKINEIFRRINEVFSHDNIQNFECLPSKDEDRQMFRKEFFKLKSTIRAVFLQGFKWDNEYGAKVDLTEKTYRILTMRYKDLPSNRGNTSGGTPRPGYIVDVDLSTMEMDKIDAAYLESQFKIVTMQDIIDVEKDAKKMLAIHEIRNSLGVLSEIQQRYAQKILDDILTGTLELVEDKSFMQYIQEYQERAIRAGVHKFAQNVGINEEELFSLYVQTGHNEVDQLRLERLEESADPAKLKEFYGCSVFKARVKLHQDLKAYIEERKADKDIAEEEQTNG